MYSQEIKHLFNSTLPHWQVLELASSQAFHVYMIPSKAWGQEYYFWVVVYHVFTSGVVYSNKFII